MLAYSHENSVEPFLEPVLALCQALLDKDQRDMHRNLEGKLGALTSSVIISRFLL